MAGLLPRLWIPASAPFQSLEAETDLWVDDLEEQRERWGHRYEPGIFDAAVRAMRELSGTQGDRVLLRQDLHVENVLAAEREPWLVIDPKPLAGEREFSVAPIVRDRELGHSRAQVLGRIDRLCSDLSLDRDRARGWAIAQTMAWAFDPDGVHEKHIDVARWLLESA